MKTAATASRSVAQAAAEELAPLVKAWQSLGREVLVAVDVSSRGQTVLAKFHGTRVPDGLLNLINVQDFATPVSQVEVFRQGNDTLFELSVNGQFDYRYDQADKMFIIEVKKRVATTTAKQYQGKPISLNFQDIPVRTVLQIIADFNNLNLVTTDSVSGNITLRLDGERHLKLRLACGLVSPAFG